MRDKVTGQAQYVEDLPDLPNTAFGATLLSPYSHARILPHRFHRSSQDAWGLRGRRSGASRRHEPKTQARAARAFKNYRRPGFRRHRKSALRRRSRRRGRRRRSAHGGARAREKIHVEYEPLPAVFDAVEALAPGAPNLHEERGSNLLLEDSLAWGDIDEGFRQAERVFEETYSSPSMFHHPMEPIGGCLVHYAQRRSECLAADQLADARRRGVRALSRYRTGKSSRARALRRRRFRLEDTHDGAFRGALAVTKNRSAGALDAVRGIQLSAELAPCGGIQSQGRRQSRWNDHCAGRRSHRRHRRLYHRRRDCGAQFGDFRLGLLSYSASAHQGPMRLHQQSSRWPHPRHGQDSNHWGIECTMDSVARQMGIDPYEFRKKNVLMRGDFVCKGTPRMDTDYLDFMAEAIAGIGWDGKSNLTRASKSGGSRWARGRGMALSLRHGSQGGGRAYALATMDARGVVTIQHNAPEIGQGTHNLFSVVAAQTLDIPQNQMLVRTPDTAVSLPFAGVSAQRTTMQMGNAVHNACNKLKQEMFSLAAQAKGGKPEEWQMIEGRLCWGETSFSISEIIRIAGGGVVLKAVGYHSVPPMVKDSAFAGMDHWAPSGAAVDLEVNRDTGELRILGYAVIADAGKAIHYPSAKAQVDGGAVMGFGHALFEETIYQDGQFQNGDPFQYRLPVMKDIPADFHSSMLEKGDGPGPFGSKGMAQTSIVTVGPAIGNAVYDALGVRVRSLPITPEKILRAMGKI